MGTRNASGAHDPPGRDTPDSAPPDPDGPAKPAVAGAWDPAVSAARIGVMATIATAVIARIVTIAVANIGKSAPPATSAANAAGKSSGPGSLSGKLVNPYLLVPAVVVSGIFGVIALRLRVNETGASKDFANAPSYAIWVASVSGVLMLATFLSGLAWRDFQRAWRLADKTTHRGTVIAYSVVGIAAILGTFWVISPLYTPLFFFNWRALTLSIVTFVASATCFCGLLLINGIVHKRAAPRGFDPVSAGESIRELMRLRSALRKYLISTAVIITAIMISLGALRNSLNAYYETDITSTGILVFGAIFAGLLAIISIPAYVAWRASAQALRNDLYPIPQDGRPSKEWYLGRSNLEILLEMRVGTGQRFAVLAGIASPILISIISVFIPTIHGG